ncbi:hypothetical protein [Pseudoalteromonas tunicata]|jgi:hypothetical protein|uniref:MSHA biogenesis protein MshK n=2 Tax=Pseudoalteromonas tunicata TaxID=314281 RepID=A4C7Y5_9GAMM|nr:hypothetical protein [Pseudoalteromonas tunicata]AAU06137.1 MshK [Pseudoalteromonas tunicata]ATC93207.1 hypothetical protein PTUN_a0409 [Pseudoalteromonas tunicata]AXT32270.1 hypothetical protein D1819_16520 [Pseudoalteromonas tunicata]EAR28700.1 hypothetical protein PTD2_06649 [Pseudoalteromonas tunicata D2]
MKSFYLFSIWLLLILPALSFGKSYQDPTKPNIKHQKNVSVAGSLGTLRLESVIRKQGKVKVVISGKIYAKGEQVGEYVLSKINADTVYLTRGSEQLKLELYHHEIKR